MRMFGALLAPVFSTPTLLNLAGVPGAANPASRWNFTGTAAGAGPANAAKAMAAMAADRATREEMRAFLPETLPSPQCTVTVFGVEGGKIEVLPRAIHANVREQLRVSQRGRMICAVADAVAEKGYAATTVADVIALAGVSRKSFYEHFDSKEDCFLASYDTGAAAIFDAMAVAAEGLEDWEEILDSVFTTWLEFLAADLAFTRAYMVEFWAAGDAARERWKTRRDRTAGLLKALHERARAQDPAIVPVSDTLIAAVVGGVNRVVISEALDGDADSLVALRPELLRFIKMNLAAHDSPG
jgi:AcrR family transcriptional regulator